MPPMYNFSAGPSVLPRTVLERAQAELLDWHGSGQSVMEMSHRSAHFLSIAEKVEADLRQLLAIPDAYQVLFLQGGASTQFAMLPFNLLNGKSSANYVSSGAWSKKAISEADKFTQVHIAAAVETVDGIKQIPTHENWDIAANSAYLHYTANETIDGLEFHNIPDSGDIPLVSDMSSTILSRPLDISRFGLIYAGAQKNMGPAGVTVVIIRDDLIGEVPESVPSMLSYRIHAKNRSMYNTPPTYNWYMLGLVLEWLQDQGGLTAIETINRRKSNKLYQVIDHSDFYHNPVALDSRSRMNIPFTLAKPELDGQFLSEAKATGLLELKGHRSVGGMRASLYNAMPESGVDALIEFMRNFEQQHN